MIRLTIEIARRIWQQHVGYWPLRRRYQLSRYELAQGRAILKEHIRYATANGQLPVYEGASGSLR